MTAEAEFHQLLVRTVPSLTKRQQGHIMAAWRALEEKRAWAEAEAAARVVAAAAGEDFDRIGAFAQGTLTRIQRDARAAGRLA